jgi:hypothetical protein
VISHIDFEFLFTQFLEIVVVPGLRFSVHVEFVVLGHNVQPWMGDHLLCGDSAFGIANKHRRHKVLEGISLPFNILVPE